MGRGNKSLLHDQDGRHAHIYMVKTLQKSSPEPVDQFPQNLACSIGDSSPLEFVQMMTLFYSKVKFGNLGFSLGKSENNGIFGNYYSP